MRLRLPPTMSFPSSDETPRGVDLGAVDLARASACIEPGYRISVPDDVSNYDFYALVNVHSDDLWRVFDALVQRLPEPTAAILNERDVEPYLGTYVPTVRLMSILRLFRTELVNDVFLEFGVIHGDREGTHEVFVTYAKYLKVWGRDVASFRDAMAGLGLYEQPGLDTINQFPLVLTALNRVLDGAAHHTETIDGLTERLRDLDSA